MDMLRRATWIAVTCLLTGSLARAQDSRVELSATAGWTFSDGVTGAEVPVPGVGTVREINPKDAFSWGLRLGVMVSKNAEIGFLYSQEPTELELVGTSTTKLGDESIQNYHGYFAYNFGAEHAKARPYVLFGLGATGYGTVKASVGGEESDIGGTSKLSVTAAVGVKVFPSPRVGIRLESRWTPTRVAPEDTGWWCDPYWGCYLRGDFVRQGRTPRPQYLTQLELSGGLIFRF
jgi:opacity protein-like surface antigen